MKSLWDNEKRVALTFFGLISISFILALSLRQFSRTGNLIASDGVGYFSHLPSILLDHDVDYRDEFKILGERLRNQWTIGTAIAWTPFFLAGQAISRLGAARGLEWPVDGTGFPEQLLVCWGSVLYGAAAVALSFRLCCRFFETRWSAVGTAIVFAASNLPYYMLCEPYMSHAVSAFFATLLLYITVTREELDIRSAAGLGLLGGLCALTRPQDGLLLALPFVWCFLSGQSLKKLILPILVAAVLSLGLFSLQVAVWNHSLPVPPVKKESHLAIPVRGGYQREERYHWTDPLFKSQLFGERNGLFLWHPIYLFAVAGWLALYRRDRRLITIAFLALLMQAYVISAWGGQAQTFGGRMFLCLFSLFNLGFIALLSRPLARRVVLITGLLLILWNLRITVLYRQAIGNGSGPPSFAQLLRRF